MKWGVLEGFAGRRQQLWRSGDESGIRRALCVSVVSVEVAHECDWTVGLVVQRWPNDLTAAETVDFTGDAPGSRGVSAHATPALLFCWRHQASSSASALPAAVPS